TDGRTLVTGGYYDSGVDRAAVHQGALRLWDVATATERREVYWYRFGASALGWLSDGRIMAVFGDAGRVRVADLSNTESVQEYKLPKQKDEAYYRSFALSPDAKTLAFVGNVPAPGKRDGVAALHLMDTATGQTRSRVEAMKEDQPTALAFAP